MEQSPTGTALDPTFVPLASIPDSAEPLREHLAQAGRLPVLHGLALVVQMLSVLQEAHSRGQVHGALSLDSLLLTHCGRIQVCEPAPRGSEPTPSTPPEQIAGGTVDTRSDIYAAAVVAYELLAGTSPFQGAGCQATWPPRAARHDLPPAIEPVFRKALAQEPAQRYAGAGEFSRALQDAIGMPLWNRALPSPASSRHAARHNAQAKARRQARTGAHAGTAPRRRTGFLVGAVGLAVAIVIAAGLTEFQSRDAGGSLASSVAKPMVEPVDSLDATEALEPIVPVAQVVGAGLPLPHPDGALQVASPDEREADVPPALDAPGRARMAARVESPQRRAATGSRPERRTRIADARSPASQCTDRMAVARELCVSIKCATADFRAHPTCARLHAEAQIPNRLAELRGGP